MIEAVVGAHVRAPAERVRALYEDPANWARVFPETIRGARVVEPLRRAAEAEEHAAARGGAGR